MAEPHKDEISTDQVEITDKLERQDDTNERWSNDTTSTSALTNRGRNRSTAYLDGLRGIACFMVYMSHHVPWFYGFDNSENSLERGYGDGASSFVMLPFIRIFFTGGSSAVAIFFVLSGYVLARSPLAVLREGQVSKCYTSLKSAAIRRPIRLFLPPAVVTLGFACIMQLPAEFAPKMTWPEPKSNLFLQIVNWIEEFIMIANPFKRHGIAERWFPYDPPLWTIAIELRGSIILFALIAAYSRVTPWIRFLLFVVSGLVFLFTYQWSMACFMAGTALAINDQEGYDQAMFKRLSARARSLINIVIFIVGWYLISQPGGKRDPGMSFRTPGWYYLTMLIPRNYFIAEFWRYWQAWGSVLIVYGLLKIRSLQHVMTSDNIRYLGKVSFALYLTHIPFLWVVADRIYRVFGTARMEFETAFDNLMYIPDLGPRGLSTRFLVAQSIILPLNVLLAHFVTIWIDEPSNRMSRVFADRMLSKSASANQTMPTKEEARNS